MQDVETIKKSLMDQFKERLKVPLMDRVREVLSANDADQDSKGVEDKIGGLKRLGKRFDRYKIGTVISREFKSE
jgi:hypothetical protein